MARVTDLHSRSPRDDLTTDTVLEDAARGDSSCLRRSVRPREHERGGAEGTKLGLDLLVAVPPPTDLVVLPLEILLELRVLPEELTSTWTAYSTF
ncbi:MAG: hypothetical protein JRM85_09440 [Nitrososphaerota archaeon]|jgi:hypothetical protein|nr:hypothetical protein [Nitrososphaerota archaeon]